MTPPLAYVVHRICEEFSVMPHVAARALELDTGLIGEVLDVRAFVRAWHAKADYEAQEPRPSRGPVMPKALADRLTLARFERLRAKKGCTVAISVGDILAVFRVVYEATGPLSQVQKSVQPEGGLGFDAGALLRGEGFRPEGGGEEVG